MDKLLVLLTFQVISALSFLGMNPEERAEAGSAS